MAALCLSRTFTRGSAMYVVREFPEVLAQVRSIRSQVMVGEGFVRLPWVRQRDRRGRFVATRRKSHG